MLIYFILATTIAPRQTKKIQTWISTADVALREAKKKK